MATIMELGGVRPTIGGRRRPAPRSAQHARLGAGSMLAAGAVLSERWEIGPGMLAAGVPAVEKKPLSGSARGWSETAAGDYQQYRHLYLTTSVVIEGS